jgi:SsrA-binding protein
MPKKNNHRSKTISNRRARFDYALDDSLVVGLQLTGREVRAIRDGHAQLTGAYVTVRDNELWLINATISSTNGVILSESEQTQARKLLAKRREINELIAAKQDGRTIVPLEILPTGRYIKLRLAAGRGKKQYDKRQAIKTRDQRRQMSNALKRVGPS